MRKPIQLATAAVALALCGSAQAQTIFATGNYGAGEQVFGAGDLTLGPGTYRFSFATTAPFAEFYGQVQKESYWAAWCDERDGNGEFFCGGDNVPTIPLFDPVTPTLYQLKITVNPWVETFTPDDFVVRQIEFDDCCSYAFDFIGASEGSFSISYQALPEPASWALLILGFGVVGGALRRKAAPRLATS